MTLFDGKNVCKSCHYIGSDKDPDDPDVCSNPKSPKYKKFVDWEGGEGCRAWISHREESQRAEMGDCQMTPVFAGSWGHSLEVAVLRRAKRGD